MPNAQKIPKWDKSHTLYIPLQLLFYNEFRATRSKTNSLPAALNQARRIDTLDEFYLYGACKSVLHIVETIVIHCYVTRSDLKYRLNIWHNKHVNVWHFLIKLSVQVGCFLDMHFSAFYVEAVYGVRIIFEKPRWYARYSTLYMLSYCI